MHQSWSTLCELSLFLRLLYTTDTLSSSTAAIVADLSSFASYPKSQPVARITLLRALLQDPTACRVVHHDKGLAFYEVLERGRQQQVRVSSVPQWR